MTTRPPPGVCPMEVSGSKMCLVCKATPQGLWFLKKKKNLPEFGGKTERPLGPAKVVLRRPQRGGGGGFRGVVVAVM